MTTDPSTGLERWSYRFFGRVQGVGFRVTAVDCTRGKAVTGWVRNEPDGSVGMEIQGPPDQIRAVIDDLLGRMSANIRSMDRNPATAVAGESEFLIRR